MKRHQRRAYSLILLMAALPLFVVVAVLGTQLCHRAMRVQREAVYHTQNNDAATRLVRQIETDAQAARRAEVHRDGETETLELVQDGQSFIYSMESDTVVRTLRRGTETWVESSWRFHKTQVRYRIEEADLDAPVAWISFEFNERWKKNSRRARRVSAAARLSGENPR